MSSFFYKVLDWCRWIFGIVPKSALGSPRAYLIFHYSLVALITIILSLWPVNEFLRAHIGFLTPNPDLPMPLQKSWCGILFLLLYLIVRTVLYLLAVFGIEEESEFPDIEADWKEILTALDRERVYLDELPLFLVNGLTPQQEVSAFDAAFEGRGESEWRVVAPPVTRTSAVVRVFVGNKGIFLCMSGVGVTSCQQGKVVTEPDAAPVRSQMGGPSPSGTVRAGQLGEILAKSRSATGTMAAAPSGSGGGSGGSGGGSGGYGGGSGGSPSAAPAAAPVSRTFLGTMMPGGLKRAMQTFAAANQNAAKGYGKQKVLPATQLESLVGVRRIHFLCNLIAKARAPFCGINGMLQAIPLSWAVDPETARRLAAAVRDDLIAVHQALHLQFPVVAMITELDDVSGVREFLLRSERLHPGLRMSRAGSSFAAGADVNESNAEWVVDAGLKWFRGWVYNSFSYDIDNKDNPRLFQMICEMGQRRESLVVLLRECLYRIVRPSIRLHGVYFSATGRSSTEQGFIRGVLDKLPDSQNEVAWAPQYVRTMRQSRMITILLFIGAGVSLVVSCWMLYQIFEYNR